MWDNSDILDEQDIELLSFCYFFLGALLPGFWGYLFLSYALDPIHFNQNSESCSLLVDWSIAAGVIFLIHASFYSALSALACLGSRASWQAKFLKCVDFEDTFWRSFVLTFSLLILFGIFGVLNRQFESQFLACGELYKLGQMFYYVFFSILASFAIIACLIQCTLETNVFEEDGDSEQLEILRQRRRRRRRRQQHQNQIQDDPQISRDQGNQQYDAEEQQHLL